jgi:hypothetical protein
VVEEAQDLEPDPACLDWLRERQVPHQALAALDGVPTPVEVVGPVGGVRLAPRVGRPPQMDCALARALDEAGPLFAELGVHTFHFSGAYDYRTRHGSDRLSEHAHGRAIDVHVVDTDQGQLDVARDFERGAGAWRGLDPHAPGALAACIGQPRTDRGRALRTLACRLKLHSAFRVIITPDDDGDHRDHLHLEAFPDALARVRRLVGAR